MQTQSVIAILTSQVARKLTFNILGAKFKIKLSIKAIKVIIDYIYPFYLKMHVSGSLTDS